MLTRQDRKHTRDDETPRKDKDGQRQRRAVNNKLKVTPDGLFSLTLKYLLHARYVKCSKINTNLFKIKML